MNPCSQNSGTSDRMRWLLAVVIAFIWLLGPPVCVQCDEIPAVGATSAEINEWITALGGREFDTRDRAMRSLIAAGQMAVEPVRAATGRRDPEVATRAVMVLKGIGEKGDISTLEIALAALTSVAESTISTPVSKRALDAKERLEGIRQDRTVEYLRSLGAEVSPEFTDVWVETHIYRSVFSIEIGNGWKGTENDLARLKWLRDAELVCLVGPKVSDSWIQYLRDMPRLNVLKVKRANISTQAIQEMAKLERLRALRLMYIPVGDEFVPHLEKLEGLIHLQATGHKLTLDGEKKLKVRFNDQVDCQRGGAMLGVRANGKEEPCVINEVVPESAADKAGLQVDDEVVKFNGQPVKDFTELKSFISEHSPGDSVTVEVKRGAEVVPIKVSFGEWD